MFRATLRARTAQLPGIRAASPRTARTISFDVAPQRARILTKRPMASKESPETVDGRGTGVRPNRSWLSRRAVRGGLILGLAYAAVRRPRAAAHSPERERPSRGGPQTQTHRRRAGYWGPAARPTRAGACCGRHPTGTWPRIP